MQNDISPNLPWQKWQHRQYLLSQTRARLSLAERGAFLDLKDIAATQSPFASIPNDDDAVAGWLSITLNQWVKIKDKVLHDWVLEGGRYFLPMLLDDQQPNHVASDTPAAPKSTKRKQKESTSAEISAKRAEAAAASHAKRQANKLANLQNSELQSSKTELQNLQSGIAKIANDELQNCKPVSNELQNGGIKGGDLDQDLELDSDLNQNLKNIRATESSAGRVSAFKTELSEVFEHWKTVFKKNSATKLDDKRKSRIVARLKDGYTVDQIKQAINGCAASEYHVENHHTDIELICRDVVKIDKFIELSSVAKKPSPSKPVHGNVNAAWGNPPAQNLNSGFVMDPELAKRIAELPV